MMLPECAEDTCQGRAAHQWFRISKAGHSHLEGALDMGDGLKRRTDEHWSSFV